jgi:hypothetical protein
VFASNLGSKAFGDDALGQTQSYDWFNRLKNGPTSVYNNELSGGPSTATTLENVEKESQFIHEDRK